MNPAATATVIGALKASPVVLSWVRKARSAGAEIRRPRKDLRYAGCGTGQVLDLEALERVDETFGRPAGDGELVVLASRAAEGTQDGVIAGLSGEEFVVLLPAGTAVQTDEPGRAWVALVSLAGRPGNTTVIDPSVREVSERRDATVIRHPRTGGVPAPATRMDRGLSARGVRGRTGPPVLAVCKPDPGR